jgi:hypothetical protein
MHHQIQMFMEPILQFCFMNVTIEKILSSSIDPIIWTIANFASFMNSKSQAHNNALEENFSQSLDIGLRFMG